MANEACDVCGSGLKPDERMDFKGQDIGTVIEAAYQMLSAAQLQLASAECCLAKVMELHKAASESRIILSGGIIT